MWDLGMIAAGIAAFAACVLYTTLCDKLKK
jgi:hypothetical protein